MTGIGYSLMEEMIINDGKVATTNFGEYKIPTIKDVPTFKGSVTKSRLERDLTTACRSAKRGIFLRPRLSPMLWKMPAACGSRTCR